MKIKHSDVEALRNDPRGYLTRPVPNSPGFGPHTVLRFSMLHLHKHGDGLAAAQNYLRQGFKGRGGQFTDRSLMIQLDRLTAYYESYCRCPGKACDVACRLNGLTTGGNIIAGEIARIDTCAVHSAGESYYYAFLFTTKPSIWHTQVRMPLIQFAVAQQLHCPVGEIAVGVYCHEEAEHRWKVYTDGEVEWAVRELDRLVTVAESPR